MLAKIVSDLGAEVSPPQAHNHEGQNLFTVTHSTQHRLESGRSAFSESRDARHAPPAVEMRDTRRRSRRETRAAGQDRDARHTPPGETHTAGRDTHRRSRRVWTLRRCAPEARGRANHPARRGWCPSAAQRPAAMAPKWAASWEKRRNMRCPFGATEWSHVVFIWREG
jgi:hypothetical protein